MSGGHWDYSNSDLGYDIFGYNVDISYDLTKKDKEMSRIIVRKSDPLEDREVSELVYDVMCLLCSYDYYVSGDISEEQYRTDTQFFKSKWFGKTFEERMKKQMENYTEEFKNTMNKIFLGECDD